MSEPYDPVPPPGETPPGPHTDLWTLTLQGEAGALRLVPVFGVDETEARAQAELRPGERILRVDRGGTLPRPKTRQEIDEEQRDRWRRQHDRLHPLAPMQTRILP